MSRNGHIPRVGLITTMSLDTTWPEQIVAHARDIHRKAKLAFSEMGYELVAAEEIARTNAEMTEQGECLRTEHAEVLVIQVATWTYANTSVSAAVKSALNTAVLSFVETATATSRSAVLLPAS